MKKKEQVIHYQVFDSIEALESNDAWLLQEARSQTRLAYAPYSNYHVAAVARMDNGEIIHGTNQENASFPVGICAERVLLSAVSSVFPGERIDTVAVSYNNNRDLSDHPVAPCGVCRQSLAEFEERMNHPVRLILGGMQGEVFVFESAGALLPFAFRSGELGQI